MRFFHDRLTGSYKKGKSMLEISIIVVILAQVPAHKRIMMAYGPQASSIRAERLWNLLVGLELAISPLIPFAYLLEKAM